MRVRYQLLISFVLVSLFNVGHAQDNPFIPSGLAKIRETAAKWLDDNKPESETVLDDTEYFIKEFYKPRKNAAGKTFAMTSTDQAPFVFFEIAKAMKKTAEEHGADAAKVILEWEKAEKEVLDRLATQSVEGQALSENERNVWQEFLDQWEKDVKAKDETRFKDALDQAAYEIVKAGLKIKTQQDKIARTRTQAPSSTAAGVTGSGRFTTGAYPFHERLMNQIYRKHDRRMNRVSRIRARGGR